jgi:hypothetical protein
MENAPWPLHGFHDMDSLRPPAGNHGYIPVPLVKEIL